MTGTGRHPALVCLAATAALLLGSCRPRTSTSAPLPPPGPVVSVSMQEYAFVTSSRSMPSSQTVFRVRNRGQLDHELVLLGLPEDLSSLDEQLKGSERRAVDTIFILPARRPGQAGVFAVDLRPGRYAFACFTEASDGEIHARKGMTFEFNAS